TVDRESVCAERTDSVVRPSLLRLVVVVEDKDAFAHEEEKEACADDRERVARIVERPKRLRKDVEEGDRDDDTARKGDQRHQLATQAQRKESARERGQGGDTRERDRDPRHSETRMRTILAIICRTIVRSIPWAEHALTALDDAGYRRGGARRAVVDLLARQNCCLSAQEIFDGLRRARRPVGIASVYRALDALVDLRLVKRVDAGD